MPVGRICSETGAICFQARCLHLRRCLHPARVAREDERRRRKPQRKVWNSARWQRLREQVRARDGGRCTECGASERLSVHHLVPLAAGGAPFDPHNCLTLCASCHGRRESKRPPGGETR